MLFAKMRLLISVLRMRSVPLGLIGGRYRQPGGAFVTA
jgi:hypothetical protein